MKGRKLYCISLKNSSYWKALCHLCIEAFILYKVNRASLLVMVCFNTPVNGCLMARDWTEWQFMAQQRLGNAVGAYVASVSHLLLKLGGQWVIQRLAWHLHKMSNPRAVEAKDLPTGPRKNRSTPAPTGQGFSTVVRASHANHHNPLPLHNWAMAAR